MNNSIGMERKKKEKKRTINKPKITMALMGHHEGENN